MTTETITPNQIFRTGKGRFDVPEPNTRDGSINMKELMLEHINKFLIIVTDTLSSGEIKNFVEYQHQYAKKNELGYEFITILQKEIPNSTVAHMITGSISMDVLSKGQQQSMLIKLQKLEVLQKILNRKAAYYRYIGRFLQIFSMN